MKTKYTVTSIERTKETVTITFQGQEMEVETTVYVVQLDPVPAIADANNTLHLTVHEPQTLRLTSAQVKAEPNVWKQGATIFGSFAL